MVLMIAAQMKEIFFFRRETSRGKKSADLLAPFTIDCSTVCPRMKLFKTATDPYTVPRTLYC